MVVSTRVNTGLTTQKSPEGTVDIKGAAETGSSKFKLPKAHQKEGPPIKFIFVNEYQPANNYARLLSSETSLIQSPMNQQVADFMAYKEKILARREQRRRRTQARKLAQSQLHNQNYFDLNQMTIQDPQLRQIQEGLFKGTGSDLEIELEKARLLAMQRGQRLSVPTVGLNKASTAKIGTSCVAVQKEDKSCEQSHDLGITQKMHNENNNTETSRQNLMHQNRYEGHTRPANRLM